MDVVWEEEETIKGRNGKAKKKDLSSRRKFKREVAVLGLLLLWGPEEGGSGFSRGKK